VVLCVSLIRGNRKHLDWLITKFARLKALNYKLQARFSTSHTMFICASVVGHIRACLSSRAQGDSKAELHYECQEKGYHLYEKNILDSLTLETDPLN